MIIVIDNYDSFVYNLVRYMKLANRNVPVRVFRNDAIDVDGCLALKPKGIILSPGPKTPKEAGICMELIAKTPRHIPLLGVCLGHQCIVNSFGGETRRAEAPVHGMASQITHNGKNIFAHIPNPVKVGRYHSLISDLPASISELKAVATCDQGKLMAVAHKNAPWYGVQFHPESVLTEYGRNMIDNFSKICQQYAH